MSFIEYSAIRVLEGLARRGSLKLDLPSGSTPVIGSGDPRASLTVLDYSAVTSILRTGLTGFAEAYMAGTLETDDLRRLLEWGEENQRAWFESGFARVTSPIRQLWQRIRPERRHPRVRTMNDHYNLGPDFYAAWLDESMTYSSARFTTPDEPLDQAQRNKYEAIAYAAGLQPGMRILEIGSGYGGFAEFAAAERGCEVVGITLSEDHAAFAGKRLAEAGLADRVEIRVQDFREVIGQYDAVVSIEMIESVDETNWLPLFETIEARLAPGARAVLQVITIGDTHWEQYRRRADFIQQYIFPGGQLPAPKVLRFLADRTGLEIEKIETFGPDYARTLDRWREAFEAAWETVRPTFDLDDRFYRMWELYLTLCAAGFRIGRINVEQWVFAKPAPL